MTIAKNIIKLLLTASILGATL